MGLFGLFNKNKKETLDKGLEKTKQSVFSKIARAPHFVSIWAFFGKFHLTKRTNMVEYDSAKATSEYFIESG